MAGMVMQQGNSIEIFAELCHRRVIDAEEDELIL